MIKTKFSVLMTSFLLVITFCTNAQNVLIPYYNGDSELYGFRDSLTDNVVIEARFNVVTGFSEGLAAVNIGGSYEYAVEYEYEDYDSDELTFYGGKWGFIDEKGKEIIPLKYDDVTNFFQGVALVRQDSNMGCINKVGVEIIPLKYDKISLEVNILNVMNEGLYGIFDLAGKELLPVEYLDVRLSQDSRTALVQTSNLNYGLLNLSTKKYIVAPELTSVDIFNRGNNFFASKNKQNAVYDFSGTLTIPFTKYNSMSAVDSSIIIVSNGIQYGVCDLTEKFIIPFGVYSEIHSGTCFLTKDSANESVYNSIVLNYLQVCKEGKWGCLDIIGNTLIPTEYDEIVYYDNIIAALKGNKWMCFDRNNISVMAHDTNVFKNNELIYDWDLSTYQAKFTVNGNEYLMDMQGKLIDADRDKYFEDVSKAGGIVPKKLPVKK
jgi:hypothetical protein